MSEAKSNEDLVINQNSLLKVHEGLNKDQETLPFTCDHCGGKDGVVVHGLMFEVFTLYLREGKKLKILCPSCGETMLVKQ